MFYSSFVPNGEELLGLMKLKVALITQGFIFQVVKAAAAVAQLVKRPELKSLEEVQLSRLQFNSHSEVFYD